MGSIMENPGPPEVGSALSICNYPVKRLSGPGLLQQLVQPSEQDGQHAIDFLNPDGSRTFISYSEFHHASDVLASRIVALAGTRSSEDLATLVVPVLIPQSPDLYIALLAILKAGGAFCPMNLDTPLERAKFILADVSARVVITTSELAAKLPDGDQTILLIDRKSQDGPPSATIHRQLMPQDLAYVMYTSGSTGTPKGVGVSHDAVTQSLLAHDRHIPPFTRFLQFASPTFDVSVFEIFFPLFRGRTLVGCARSVMLNDLPAVLRQMDVDACELTPSVAGSLLRKRENAPNLRLLLTIGEMLTRPVVEEFGGDNERPSMLWGMYGPTEAAIHCTLQPAFSTQAPVCNIGMPLDTVSTFILGIPTDDAAKSDSRVLPHGEVGELAVGGYQLADAYLNRPKQTAAAFIDTPYGRLYRTGDKARMLPDGSLECLGRIAEGQVKIRGQRMELGEIEHAALRTKGCHSAVAVVIDAILVLFCAVDDGAGDAVVDVTDSCRQWLPGFMLPGDIVVMKHLPRLASGKVNRKQLVAEYRARTAESVQELCYTDDLERLLCDLTSGCMGVKISPAQDLPSLGLDSLSAIKLASACREAGVAVDVIDLLEARTISALQIRLRAANESRPVEATIHASKPVELNILDIVSDHPSLTPRAESIQAVTPCTPLQASMLAETTAEPRAYCNWVELKFTGSHAAEGIRGWFLQLAAAQEILRTGFIHHQGQFLQVIFDALPDTAFSTTDCSVREYEMQDDSDLLRPVRVQIGPSSQNGTAVVIQVHHAVYDGWSLDLMLLDLASLARGEGLEQRAQFRQISAYCQSAEFHDRYDAARAYWAENLLGFQPPPLPVLHSKASRTSAVRSFSVILDLSPRDIKASLQLISCGSQVLFQAALAWLWSAITGSQDAVVGSIQSGRSLPVSRIAEIVGPCIAAVPLRTNLTQMQTLKDLLVNIQAGNRAALSASVLPLAEIKRAAGLRPAQAVYDVLFVYQESQYSRDQRDTNDEVRVVAHQDYLETKLLVEVEPRENEFICQFTYHEDVFPKSIVTFLAESTKSLVDYILDSLDADITSIPRIFPQHSLSIFNPKPATFTGIPDLAHAIEQVAAAFPESDAICFADQVSKETITTTTITFAQLNTAASQIGGYLSTLGAREGEAVAIVMEKSIRFYASILGSLMAGCAYLPLLPSTPVARIRTILRQARVTLCLVDTATEAALRDHLECNLVDIQSLALKSLPVLSSKPRPDPNRLAYIIYTSGSTGVPKGVCVTQLNIMSNLDALSRIYPTSHNSRLLQSCSHAFDVSVFEIFFAWMQGMCLCSATNDTLFEDLERSIRALEVTHLSMTPTVASLVDPRNVPRVEFLVTAGEAMTEVVARKWAGKLYQGYGPSETTNICSVTKMDSEDAIHHLGWSLNNTSTFVLARHGTEPMPFGCLGELCFGGDQVAQGYLDMQEQTAARFINHSAFGRIYRSGDLGRMLPDGSMVIVGRIDEQIKVRGQRVELKEITEIIRQFGAVTDCATLALTPDGDRSGTQIIAFTVPSQIQAVDFRVLDLTDELRRGVQTIFHTLTSQLPAYMIPNAVVPISVLPHTASGKLDRDRLKLALIGLNQDYRAFISLGAEQHVDGGKWTTVERQVVEAVADALHVNNNEVQRWTPLFSLGLDSISAIQVSRKLHTACGIRVPISVILRNPNVSGLARAMLDMGTSSPTQHADAPGLLPTCLIETCIKRLKQDGLSSVKILPCMPLQEGMLAKSSGKFQYLNRMLFRVDGDMSRLKDAWNMMFVRHEILRTCFISTDDARWPILQVVLEHSKLVWHGFDATSSSNDDCIWRHAQLIPQPIDSLKPAISLATIAHGTAVHMSFVCHHALYDGVAIERLLFEVEQLTQGAVLPPTPSYQQFLLRALDLPASTDEFWLQHFAEYEPRLITGLDADDDADDCRVPKSDFDLPLSDIGARLRELGVSLLALMQSAWAITLARLLRTIDVCFGNVMNGRSVSFENITQLVAPCFNTIPLRMDLSRNKRNIDLMKAFQNLNTDIMPYQFTPLRQVQSLLSQHIDRRLFDTVLLLQQPSRTLNKSLWTVERDEGEMDLPLVCEVIPVPDLDRVCIKLHASQSQSLPDRIVNVALDVLKHTVRSCLRFPGSHAAQDVLPHSLAQKVSAIRLRRSSHVPAVHEVPESTVEDWTSTEHQIREAVVRLSSRSLEQVQRHTTIYQLGLDSISAVQLASMLRDVGHQVVASDVIDHPSCSKLARHIGARARTEVADLAYDIESFRHQVQLQILNHGVPVDAIEAVVPCTHLQSSMMAQFIKSGGRNYFSCITFELALGVSAAALAEAWTAVVAANPILRTAIVPVDHSDCAFALVQCPPAALTPRLTIVPRNLAAAFDLESWGVQAAHAAAKTPYTNLWRVAIIEGDTHPTMHLAILHALYDASSLQALLDELSKAAAGHQLFRGPRLEEVVTDILGQISAPAESPAEFWTAQADKLVLNEFPVMTSLRQESASVLTASKTSSDSSFNLEGAVSSSGFTVQVILQAAWTRVLSAYLGEDSVVFGVVLSGRNTETTRNAVFPCITTLPVISNNDASNEVLLARTLEYNAGLFKQQHQPLTRIQEWLGCSGTQLFDTLLVYQKLKLDRVTPENRPWRVTGESSSVDYPISIEIEPISEGQLQYRITFFGNVLDVEQAHILLEQFDAVVHQLAFEPQGLQADLTISRPDLFSVLKPEISEIPTTTSFLHELVEVQALKTPNAIALHFVDSWDGEVPVGRKWTYKELDERGNRVARTLLSYAQTGDLVAVYFDKCPEAYFAILGILKAGCAFVALDPAAPSSRNEFILQDSNASVLVTSQELRAGLELDVRVPVVGIEEGNLSSETAHPLHLTRPLRPGDVCYCLYTSGTTGTPKGCEITHDNAVQCMLAFQHIFQGHWDERSRWLQFASLHFDVSVLEQYWSWSVGITLVAAPRDLILEDLAGTISRLWITHIDLTPSLARLLHPDDVPSLCRGVFITGGESLKQEILDAWGSKGVIYNFYGPTEATIGVTVYPRVPTIGRASNIGKQFINVGSYVLGPRTDQPVLLGGVGELCVSGRLVGKGYLRREDLTSEKFPILERFHERVYRTGDLVRVLHDGCFIFLGRADDQIKLRGQRLEVGEINHTIREGVAAIKDVATLVVRNETQQKDLLVSFVVTNEPNSRKEKANMPELVLGQEAAELCMSARDACRAKLPGYMVPTYVLPLSFMPLSANNKVELKVLRQFFTSLRQDILVTSSSPGSRSSRSHNVTEERIARVIATMQTIDMSLITAQSSIFEIGIDSISVLRLARALRKDGFGQANPSLILRHPLIKDLARALETQNPTSGSDLVAAARQSVQACAHRYRPHVCKELSLVPDQIDYIAPCSPLQQGMISRSASGNAYFNTFQLDLCSAVLIDQLRDAFQRTVAAFPILRTRFVNTTDGTVQVAVRDLPLPWTDVSMDRNTIVETVVQETKASWIHQNRGTLYQPWEAVLVNGNDERTLIIHMFHGLYDANSFTLLMDRVSAEYAKSSGGSCPSSPLQQEPTFLDALCHGPIQDFSSSKPFWVEHLEGIEYRPHLSSSPTSRVATARRQLHFQALHELSVVLGVTHQALLQAAWASVLAEHFAVNPTIGIVVSGRNIDLNGVEMVAGPLFNTIPFHARVNKGSPRTWSALIRQCHEFNAAMLAFQHTPLRDVQRWCSEGQPLFDTLFSFQQQEHFDVPATDLWKVVDSEPNADYPVALEAILNSSGHLQLLLVVQREGDELDELLGLVNRLEETLMAMAESPSNAAWSRNAGLLGAKTTTAAPDRQHGGVVVAGNILEGACPDACFTWTEEALVMRNEMAALAVTDSDSVTETTSLFGLGLDSIDIVKLCARLKRRGIEIKTSDLIRGQTIQAIVEDLHSQSRRLDQDSHESQGQTRAGTFSEVIHALRQHLTEIGESVEGNLVLPATALQESMISEMIESKCRRYFNHDILELAPTVDIQRLRGAWKAVIAGSPILRTRFVPVESPSIQSTYTQVVESESVVYVGDVDLSNHNELTKICAEATQRARNGEGRSNLLQLVFATVRRRRFLILSIAHALYDGWSLGLVHQAVQAAYQGEYQPPDMKSYVGQLETILLPEHRHASPFWPGFLQGATPTLVPTNNADPQHSSLLHRAELVSSISTTDTLAFCKSNSLTLQSLGQACWAAVLAAMTGSLDVTFGVVLSCRDTESLEQLVFPTMNTVPVRSVLHGTVSAWLHYMQDNMASIRSHQHTPLREALRSTQTCSPLFNTLFIQQRAPPASAQLRGEDWMKSIDRSSAMEYPVCVEMELKDGELLWRAACDARYLTRAETAHMLQRLDELLVRFTRASDAQVVVFSGQRVSVCGLPPAVLQNAQNLTQESASPTEEAGQDLWSPLEVTIRDILAKVSGVPVEAISKTSSIYHLGLDSISAIKVGLLLRKKGLAIGVRTLVSAGSIAAVARRVAEDQSEVLRDAATEENSGSGIFAAPADIDVLAVLQESGVERVTVESVLPATAMQVHMISVWQNTQGEVFYPSFRYRLSGQVDISTIDLAWRTLVAEAQILRTVFLSTSSRSTPILQTVLRSPAIAHSNSSGGGAIWYGTALSNLSQPFHILHVEATNADSWDIRLRVHHALYDAASLPRIMNRFASLCCSDTTESPDSSPFISRSNPRPRWHLSHQAARKQFWTEYLADADFSFPSLGCERALGASTSRISHVKQAALGDISEMANLCKAHGVSLQSLFFAAYAEFLARAVVRSGGQRPRRVVFGIYLANQAGDEDMGVNAEPLLRLVPLRAVLKETCSLLDVAAEIQQDINVISSAINVEVGLWEVKDWTGITVHSFVNFLGSLHVGTGHAAASDGRQGSARLEIVSEAAAEGVQTVSEMNQQDDVAKEGHAPELARNPVRDAFPDAVDVEVSLENEALTIGVFGSSRQVGGEEAARIIGELVTILGKVLS